MAYKVAALVSFLCTWAPIGLTGREVLMRIFTEQPLEFRVAFLNYQIKQMMLKHV